MPFFTRILSDQNKIGYCLKIWEYQLRMSLVNLIDHPGGTPMFRFTIIQNFGHNKFPDVQDNRQYIAPTARYSPTIESVIGGYFQSYVQTVLVFNLEIKIVFPFFTSSIFTEKKENDRGFLCNNHRGFKDSGSPAGPQKAVIRFKWEFPGGKIHLDETAAQCVVREIEEELMVRIEVLFRLESVEFDYDTKQIRLIPFVCKITSGEVMLTEHVAKCWFKLDEWQTIDWSGADRDLILKNQESIKEGIKI